MPREIVEVYDSGPSAIDRYTIRIGDDIHAANAAPLHPQGFGQYCGSRHKLKGWRLGKKIKLRDLPEDVKKFIKLRRSA